jgi:hypothetical protein
VLISDDPFSGFSDLLEDFFLEGVVPNEPSEIVYLPTVNDHYRVSRLVFLVNWNFRHLPYDLHSVDNLTENNVFAI